MDQQGQLVAEIFFKDEDACFYGHQSLMNEWLPAAMYQAQREYDALLIIGTLAEKKVTHELKLPTITGPKGEFTGLLRDPELAPPPKGRIIGLTK